MLQNVLSYRANQSKIYPYDPANPEACPSRGHPLDLRRRRCSYTDGTLLRNVNLRRFLEHDSSSSSDDSPSFAVRQYPGVLRLVRLKRKFITLPIVPNNTPDGSRIDLGSSEMLDSSFTFSDDEDYIPPECYDDFDWDPLFEYEWIVQISYLILPGK